MSAERALARARRTAPAIRMTRDQSVGLPTFPLKWKGFWQRSPTGLPISTPPHLSPPLPGGATPPRPPRRPRSISASTTTTRARNGIVAAGGPPHSSTTTAQPARRPPGSPRGGVTASDGAHNETVVAGPSAPGENKLSTNDWFKKHILEPIRRNGGTSYSEQRLKDTFFSGCIGLATLTTAGQFTPRDPNRGSTYVPYQM